MNPSQPTQPGYHWVWVFEGWIIWEVKFNLEHANLEVYNSITHTWEPASNYEYYIHIPEPNHPESTEPF